MPLAGDLARFIISIIQPASFEGEISRSAVSNGYVHGDLAGAKRSAPAKERTVGSVVPHCTKRDGCAGRAAKGAKKKNKRRLPAAVGGEKKLSGSVEEAKGRRSAGKASLSVGLSRSFRSRKGPETLAWV